MPNEFLQAALTYIKAGWNVIPLRPKDKKPLLSSWQKWQTDRVSKADAREWWGKHPDANVGIITGVVSGVIVLDVDGPSGEESLKKVAKGLPPTPISNTGKGRHYIFRHPGGNLRNFAGKQPGLDFRGDGGYIVAPPSIHPSGRRYEWAISPDDTDPADAPEWLLELLEQKKEVGAAGGGIDPAKVLHGVPEGKRDETLYRYACRLRQQGMGKPEATVLVLQAAGNCTPPFPEDEARAKVEGAWKYPAGGGGDVQQAAAQLEDLADRPDDVWAPETIGALAVLKVEGPAQYARVKAGLKGKCNLNDLERAVNKQVEDDKKLRLVEPGEPPEPLERVLPKIPLKELRCPPGWNLNENGIWRPDTRKGATENICACAVPVILTQRLKNADTGEEKVELAFYRDRSWHFLKSERSTVFNRTSIIQLTDKSLPVSSETSKHLVQFLTDLERENLQTLPIRKSTTSLGWVGKHFLPGAQGDIVLDLEDGTAALAGGYRESGTLAGWVEMVDAVRYHPVARFMLAASFAAPLMKLVGQRVFIIHAWGGTRGGKTAALKTALSVWGCPEDLLASFNATKVGLERLAAFYSDLPLGIDEKQVVGDRQGFIESLVYLLGMGRGKVRGAKGGGLQAMTSWRSLVLSTGEEPLSTASSAGGVKTRTLELYGKPIPDEATAIQMHQETGLQFGTAGPEFVRRLLAADIDIREQYIQLQNELRERHAENITSHLAAMAVIVLADQLASQWIFGLPKGDAVGESIALAEHIAGMLETAAEADDALRAYEYTMSWFHVNAESFRDTALNREQFGTVENDITYFYPTIFDRAMKEGGFNPRRVLRDWAERGWIEAEEGRYQVRKYIGGKRVRVIGVRMGLLDGTTGRDNLNKLAPLWSR